MKKVGGGFFGKLGGEIKYYNSAFLIYCVLYQKCRIVIFNSPLNLPTKPSPLNVLHVLYMQYIINA